ncbi:MAG: hypothetical protein ACIAQZ_11890 [Sedimentisphaeraceae bacterium JB056]
MAKFTDSKTFFQTNKEYDRQLDFSTDAVVLHPHNILPHNNIRMHDSWKGKADVIGRMFFSDSDDLNEYWKGLWDGESHTDETEVDSEGNTVMCSGIRPYMLPTEGWIKYLIDKKVRPSLDNGVNAVLPEEPLAHTFSGYEDAFKLIYEKYYNTKWQGENSSAIAYYKTAYLKSVLYNNLETTLAEFTKQYASENNKNIDFVVPVHSIFSNKATNIVAPLGLSLKNDDFDGYIGQVWTGPINWALKNYNSDEKSFFTSAIVLYDYFAQLVIGTDKKMWLLVDPVEDDPNHDWEDFKSWYQQCTVAMLMMTDIDSYEIMPWPERVFLNNTFTPGIEDNAQELVPAGYLKQILSVTQVLQDVRLGGDWLSCNSQGQIGIAVADSTMWQKNEEVILDGLYGLRLPLLHKGILASNFIMERLADVEYTKRFSVIVVSYKDFKPYEQWMNELLIEWVSNGGVLVVIGHESDELDREESFWWKDKGLDSPTDALLDGFGFELDAGSWGYGEGEVVYYKETPSDYVDVVSKAASLTNNVTEQSGYFAVRRGDFVIAYSQTEQYLLDGLFVNVFEENLSLQNGINLEPGQYGIFKDVSSKLNDVPCVLHTTYRLMKEKYFDDVLHFCLKAPKVTETAAKISLGGRTVKNISAESDGKKLSLCHCRDDSCTILITVPSRAEGVDIKIEFEQNKG